MENNDNLETKKLINENIILKQEIEKLKSQLNEALLVANQIDKIFRENIQLINQIRNYEAINDDLQRRLRIILQKNKDNSPCLQENDSKAGRSCQSTNTEYPYIDEKELDQKISNLSNQNQFYSTQIAKLQRDLNIVVSYSLNIVVSLRLRKVSLSFFCLNIE